MKHITLAAVLAAAAVLPACAKSEQSPPAPPPPAGPATPAATSGPANAEPPASAEASGERLSASRAAEEACVDKWLAGRGLDPYGNPRGTLYAGGTPLFDERTGEHVDRLAYVYKRQPLAREVCRPTEVH
jgi:hypothetical protein